MAEVAGKTEEMIVFNAENLPLHEVRTFCFNKYGLEEDLTIRLAVNQVLQQEGLISNGDEIAFLPPYAGG